MGWIGRRTIRCIGRLGITLSSLPIRLTSRRRLIPAILTLSITIDLILSLILTMANTTCDNDHTYSSSHPNASGHYAYASEDSRRSSRSVNGSVASRISRVGHIERVVTTWYRL